MIDPARQQREALVKRRLAERKVRHICNALLRKQMTCGPCEYCIEECAEMIEWNKQDESP